MKREEIEKAARAIAQAIADDPDDVANEIPTVEWHLRALVQQAYNEAAKLVQERKHSYDVTAGFQADTHRPNESALACVEALQETEQRIRSLASSLKGEE